MHDCPYNTTKHWCDVEVECMVLEETICEAEECYYALQKENKYLYNRVKQLEQVLLECNITLPPDEE